MRTRIKICGIREPEHARIAAEAGADAIGLVFAEISPRRITLDEARRVIAALPTFVEPIGLFVDSEPEKVRTMCLELGIRTAQLHGSESVEQVESLAPLRVVKAISFENPQAAGAALDQWRSVTSISGLLFDAPKAGAIGQPTGGTGRTLDWSTLAGAIDGAGRATLPPTLLAGGLHPENVATAIQTVRPWAVDVSSGVEVQRGIKDPDRIAAFCHHVRAADASAG